MANDIAEANYFFRDYVTADILSYCIGDCYLYHYKETLIGVRDVQRKKGFFLDVKTVPKTGSLYAPTLDNITVKEVQDCVDEMDRSGETILYVDIRELVSLGQQVLARELASLMDRKLLGTPV